MARFCVKDGALSPVIKRILTLCIFVLFAFQLFEFANLKNT